LDLLKEGEDVGQTVEREVELEMREALILAMILRCVVKVVIIDPRSLLHYVQISMLRYEWTVLIVNDQC